MTVSVKRAMPVVKRIALVAHDHKKQDLLEWAAFNLEPLMQHALYATGNKGSLLRHRRGH
jgi:methylglyoxal synthase